MNLKKVNIELKTLTEKVKALDDGYYLKAENYIYFKDNNFIKFVKNDNYSAVGNTSNSINYFMQASFEVYEKIDWWDDLPRLCRDKNGGTYLIDKNSDNLHVESDRGHFLFKSALTPLANEEIKQFIRD